MLGGEPGPYRDVVLLNTAAALIISGNVIDLKEGVKVAANTIDSGKAKLVLERMIEITNSIEVNGEVGGA